MCHLGRSVYPYINPTEMDDHDETDEVFWSPPLKYPKGSMIVNMMSSQPVSSATQYHDRTWIAVNYHKRVYIHSIRHDVDCQTGRTIDAQYFGPYAVTRCEKTSLPISEFSGSPAIVNHNEHIYVFWIDAATHYIQWASSIDPTREICAHGALPLAIPSSATAAAPPSPWRKNEFKAKLATKLQAFSSAIGGVETIHLFWSANREGGAIQWRQFDGESWSTGRPLPWLLQVLGAAISICNLPNDSFL
jgi:hypothetical protein